MLINICVDTLMVKITPSHFLPYTNLCTQLGS